MLRELHLSRLPLSALPAREQCIPDRHRWAKTRRSNASEASPSPFQFTDSPFALYYGTFERGPPGQSCAHKCSATGTREFDLTLRSPRAALHCRAVPVKEEVRAVMVGNVLSMLGLLAQRNPRVWLQPNDRRALQQIQSFHQPSRPPAAELALRNF